MSEYHQRTEDLSRAAYCNYLEGTSRTREESAAEFDRWLDKVKAEAWDEGFDECADDIGAGIESGLNPHRKETK